MGIYRYRPWKEIIFYENQTITHSEFELHLTQMIWVQIVAWAAKMSPFFSSAAWKKTWQWVTFQPGAPSLRCFQNSLISKRPITFSHNGTKWSQLGKSLLGWGRLVCLNKKTRDTCPRLVRWVRCGYARKFRSFYQNYLIQAARQAWGGLSVVGLVRGCVTGCVTCSRCPL